MPGTWPQTTPGGFCGHFGSTAQVRARLTRGYFDSPAAVGRSRAPAASSAGSAARAIRERTALMTRAPRVAGSSRIVPARRGGASRFPRGHRGRHPLQCPRRSPMTAVREELSMKGDPKVIDALNGALTIELTAINQYFCQAKMCENWGLTRLARKH